MSLFKYSCYMKPFLYLSYSLVFCWGVSNLRSINSFLALGIYIFRISLMCITLIIGLKMFDMYYSLFTRKDKK